MDPTDSPTTPQCTRTLKPATVKVLLYDGTPDSLRGLGEEFALLRFARSFKYGTQVGPTLAIYESPGVDRFEALPGEAVMVLVPGKPIRLTVEQAALLVHDNMLGS